MSLCPIAYEGLKQRLDHPDYYPGAGNTLVMPVMLSSIWLAKRHPELFDADLLMDGPVGLFHDYAKGDKNTLESRMYTVLVKPFETDLGLMESIQDSKALNKLVGHIVPFMEEAADNLVREIPEGKKVAFYVPLSVSLPDGVSIGGTVVRDRKLIFTSRYALVG